MVRVTQFLQRTLVSSMDVVKAVVFSCVISGRYVLTNDSRKTKIIVLFERIAEGWRWGHLNGKTG